MEVHPYADRFPMLGVEELDRLAADIAENGLQNPIVLDSEGRILDGRNRWAACELAGVTPETVVHEGDDLAAFVLSANVSRRHLTTGQQAMSTALVLSDDGRRENGRWKRGSVIQDSESQGRAWQVAMNQAGAILDHAPDLAPDVVAGSLALDAAFKQAEQRRDAERNALAEQERIEAEEADARARVDARRPERETGSARQHRLGERTQHRGHADHHRHQREGRREGRGGNRPVEPGRRRPLACTTDSGPHGGFTHREPLAGRLYLLGVLA